MSVSIYLSSKKLDIPDSLTPTKQDRKTWFVSPFGNNYDYRNTFQMWVPFFAMLPAFVIFIVLFFEIELTGYAFFDLFTNSEVKRYNFFFLIKKRIILSSKIRKLKKGSGFNLDLLLAGIMLTFNSFFGLPWYLLIEVYFFYLKFFI